MKKHFLIFLFFISNLTFSYGIESSRKLGDLNFYIVISEEFCAKCKKPFFENIFSNLKNDFPQIKSKGFIYNSTDSLKIIDLNKNFKKVDIISGEKASYYCKYFIPTSNNNPYIIIFDSENNYLLINSILSIKYKDIRNKIRNNLDIFNPTSVKNYSKINGKILDEREMLISGNMAVIQNSNLDFSILNIESKIASEFNIPDSIKNIFLSKSDKKFLEKINFDTFYSDGIVSFENNEIVFNVGYFFNFTFDTTGKNNDTLKIRAKYDILNCGLVYNVNSNSYNLDTSFFKNDIFREKLFAKSKNNWIMVNYYIEEEVFQNNLETKIASILDKSSNNRIDFELIDIYSKLDIKNSKSGYFPVRYNVFKDNFLLYSTYNNIYFTSNQAKEISYFEIIGEAKYINIPEKEKNKYNYFLKIKDHKTVRFSTSFTKDSYYFIYINKYENINNNFVTLQKYDENLKPICQRNFDLEEYNLKLIRVLDVVDGNLNLLCKNFENDWSLITIKL